MYMSTYSPPSFCIFKDFVFLKSNINNSLHCLNFIIFLLFKENVASYCCICKLFGTTCLQPFWQMAEWCEKGRYENIILPPSGNEYLSTRCQHQIQTSNQISRHKDISFPVRNSPNPSRCLLKSVILTFVVFPLWISRKLPNLPNAWSLPNFQLP